MAGQDPRRRELDGADQAGFVGMVLDGAELDGDSGFGQQQRGAAHRQLADPARRQAAAQHDALGPLPALQPHEAAYDGRQFVGELLDHGMHQRRGLRVVAAQHLVELGLGNLLHRRVAEGILALLLQPVAPVGQDRPEGAAAGAVADEAVVVAQLLVIGIDGDGGQRAAAMRQRGRRGRFFKGRRFFAHVNSPRIKAQPVKRAPPPVVAPAAAGTRRAPSLRGVFLGPSGLEAACGRSLPVPLPFA